MNDKIGNFSINHPLAIHRCKQIAQSIKFIVEYEKKHNVRLDRERGDLKHYFWAFTCDSPEMPGYDAVKYSEVHHKHSKNAKHVIIEANTSSRRKISGLRHEHVVPLKLLRDMLFSDKDVCAGDHKAVIKILKDNLHAAVITREEALHIDRSYRTSMPDSWSPGKDPYIRYDLSGVRLIQAKRVYEKQ
tara:strand:+ start:454 stop:1017 length:564 start_codon:yes stop_codon:yes gene_type:complete